MTISLNLSDRVVDLAGEGYDCAVRVGDLPDSSLVSVRLADNRRLCVATPALPQAHGTPQHPSELAKFDCLTLSSDASQTRGWAFRVPKAEGDEVVHLKPGGPLDCTDGQVLHDWCLAGWGIAWRSTWEVESEIAAGRLAEVLAEFAAPPNGIYAVFPQRKHLPLRVRLWIDFLKHNYSQPEFWREPDDPRSPACLCPPARHPDAGGVHLQRGGAVPARVDERQGRRAAGHGRPMYGIAAGAVLLTGLARTWWGIKGTAWYWGNWPCAPQARAVRGGGADLDQAHADVQALAQAAAAGGGLPEEAQVRQPASGSWCRPT